MAWEQSGKSRYYYRSKRIGGKVVRIYCGTGEAAQQAEAEHKAEQQERRDRREARQEYQRKFDHFMDRLALTWMYCHLAFAVQGEQLATGGTHRMRPRTIAKILRGRWRPRVAGLSYWQKRLLAEWARDHFAELIHTGNPDSLRDLMAYNRYYDREPTGVERRLNRIAGLPEDHRSMHRDVRRSIKRYLAKRETNPVQAPEGHYTISHTTNSENRNSDSLDRGVRRPGGAEKQSDPARVETPTSPANGRSHVGRGGSSPAGSLGITTRYPSPANLHNPHRVPRTAVTRGYNVPRTRPIGRGPNQAHRYPMLQPGPTGPGTPPNPQAPRLRHAPNEPS